MAAEAVLAAVKAVGRALTYGFVGKLHLSRKIQYVEFYSTSFLGLQNWLILGRIAESRIRRKVQGWDMTSNYKTSNYKTSIRRNVFDVK